jgi:phospholipid/cholesterol/gamma-HCH transport system ATP-binding protein
VDDEIVKLRDVERVTAILVTHQLPDAFYVATHEAVRRNGRLAIVPAGEARSDDVEFIVIRSGRIYFRGDATELKRSTDSYLKAFLSGWIPPLI